MIKTVRVLSSEGKASPEIVVSEDKLFLFSSAEVGIDASLTPYAQEVEEGAERATFSIFTSNSSRIKKHYNGTGAASWWYLRSPEAGSTGVFRTIRDGGTLEGVSATKIYGVSFGFCI